MKTSRAIQYSLRLFALCFWLSSVVPVFASQTVYLNSADSGDNNWWLLATALTYGGSSTVQNVVTLAAGTYKVKIPSGISGVALRPYTTLAGSGTTLIISNTFDNSVTSPALFTVSGTGIVMKNLNMTANLNYAGQAVAISVGGCTNLMIDGVSVQGGGVPNNECHGIKVGDTSSPTNVIINNCTFKNCESGIVTGDGFTGTPSGWQVTNCTFDSNYGDDMEINAPNGRWNNVTITGCTFKNNLINTRYPLYPPYPLTRDPRANSGGFGVGLSGNVTNVSVTGNTFTTYTQEAIHIENGCINSTIARNTFTNCMQGMKISAANNNTNNVFISQNTVGGVLGSGDNWGIQLVDGGGNYYPVNIVVVGNVISNFDKGIVSGASSASCLIAGNSVTNCTVGINGTPSLSINDNIVNGTYGYQFFANGVCGFNTLIGSTTIFSPNSPGGVTFAANSKGDYHRAAKGDIFWRNPATGVVSLWLVNGTTAAPSVSIGVVSTNWQVAAAGDLNGDGITDIVWRNTSTGLVSVWLMNGSGATVGSYVDIGVIASDWQIAGMGDFNSDSKADILWQNTSTGVFSLWLMNGTTVQSYADIGVVSSIWRIIGTGDYNNDGNTDIFWENISSGLLSAWLMNGPRVVSYPNLSAISPELLTSQ